MPQILRLLSGEFAAQAGKTVGDQLEKKVMLVYAGSFESMDGPVEVTPENIQALADNHNSFLEKIKRMVGASEVPLKYNPPLQLDHSTSAKDTVGRLVGNLEVGEHTIDEGVVTPALFGTIRIMGKDNIEKVEDGRWTHVSIGADFENNKITELSLTPFPAAADASLLSKNRLSSVFVGYGASGTKYYYEDGNIYDEDGNHVGKAPSINAAQKFVISNYGELSKNKNLASKLDKKFKHKGYVVEVHEMETGGFASRVHENPGEMTFSGDTAAEVEKEAKDYIDRMVKRGYLSADENDAKKLSVSRPIKEIKMDKADILIYEYPAAFGYEIVTKQTRQKIDDGDGFDTAAQAESEAKKIVSTYTRKYLSFGKLSKLTSERETELAQKYVRTKIYKDETIKIYKDNDKHGFTISGHDSGAVYSTPEEAEKVATKQVDQLSSQGEETMTVEEMRKHLATHDKCKKHLMETENLSEEDAEKKLAEATDEDKKNLSDAADEKEKKLKEEEEAKKTALSKHKSAVVQMAKNMTASSAKITLAAKKGQIAVRLSKLKAEAKITPAEIKKLDLAKLAAKSDDAVNEALKTYEAREPVIHVGLIGSTKAVSASQLQGRLKKMNMERRELEARLNMPSKRDAAVKRLKELEEEEKNLAAEEGDIVPVKHVVDHDAHWEQMKKLMDEGKHEEAKSLNAAYMSKLTNEAADVDMSVTSESTEELASEVKKMQTEFNEFVKTLSKDMGIEEKDLQ